MAPPIRILLVDDHSGLREPLAIMLGLQPDLEVVAQAASIAEARPLFASADLAVIDLGLPDGSGVDLIRELRAANPKIVIVVFSADTDRSTIAAAISAGAVGVVHKAASTDVLIDAIRRAAAGEQLLSHADLLEMIRLTSHQQQTDERARHSLERLTPRELTILQQLAAGHSDREIADELTVSIATVRTHMANILEKFGAESRLQALVFAVRYGVVEIT